MKPAEIIRKLVEEELAKIGSQRKLAWEIGVSHPTIQNILYAPDKKFKVETFVKIADYFKIPLADILGGSVKEHITSNIGAQLSPAALKGLDNIYLKLSKYLEVNPSDDKTLSQIDQMVNILIKEIPSAEKKDSKDFIVKKRKAR